MTATALYRLEVVLLHVLIMNAFGGAAFGEPVAEFALEDQNPTSVRFRTKVAPADYRQQVSVWYFGAAT